MPLTNSNGESWCQGLDGLAQRTAEYYKAGARFAKWRSVVSIPSGPSDIAVRDCAYGLARYAAIAQVQALCCFACVCGEACSYKQAAALFSTLEGTSGSMLAEVNLSTPT